MLIAGLSVVAALALVLGLGVLCIWALKKWGTGAIKGRQRVAVEIVQRIPMGPKTGLAVVRVGEKVMAVSIGEGGIRPLFELEESDRQRVIATSPTPMMHASSAEASAALASIAPAPVSGDLATVLGTKIGQAIGTKFGAMMNQAMQPSAAVVAPTTMPAVLPLATRAIPEVPSFLTDPRPEAKADREFRALLNMSLNGATRIAVFAGLFVLMGASSLQAQGQPPVASDSMQKATAAVKTLTDDISKMVMQSAAQVVIPKTVDAPPIALPKGVTAPTPRAPKAPQLNTPATSAAAPKTGNGAALTAQAAASKAPLSDMKVTPAQNANPNAATAALAPIAADDAIMKMMPQMDVKLGDGENGGLRLNGTVGIVVMMGLLTLLPTLLLMMTGFTRILIVLHFLKQAMGTQSAPPAQLLAGMALLLTAFVMGPTLSEVNQKAVTPWLDGQMTQVEMMKTGVQPFRTFMLKQTRESDLKTFVELSRLPRPATVDDVPLHVLMSAFVASELRTSFQIGFAIYLPFIIIDAVVASVLMSMGMFMLPPAMISLPFKLLLFVLVDGWSLTISSLVQSFK
jgi:flagellar biosynthetic protein FliP